MAQSVEASEDVALGAHDSHGAACLSERLVEYVAVLAVKLHLLHALLAMCHGVAQGCEGCIGVFECLGEDGLAGNLRCVGVYEVCSASAYHYAVGMGIGLDG